jgi:tetratricopeptide (TPR) repeat protein
VIHSHQGEDFIPKPEFAKVMALGFDSLLADYYWVQAVLLVGGDTNPARHATQLGRFIDVVTTLDPWVSHPYRFAAVWLTETEEQVRAANRLLRRSLEYHPDDWRNYFYLGFNLFYYLEENVEAADVLLTASRLPGAPRYLTRLVARLRSESADIEAAAVFLEELVRTAPDEASAAEYQAALDEIEIEHRARILDRARRAHQQLSGRDIESVADLVLGSHAVLLRLPDPEPSSLPESLRQGSVWELNAEGVIVSSYYGHRYTLHIDTFGQKKRAEIARQRERRLKRGGRGRNHE